MYSACSLVHSAIPDLVMSVMQPNVHEPQTFVRHHIIYFQSIPDYSFDEKISIIREVQATIPPSRLLMERCSRTGQDGWRRPGAMRYSSARTRRRWTVNSSLIKTETFPPNRLQNATKTIRPAAAQTELDLDGSAAWVLLDESFSAMSLFVSVGECKLVLATLLWEDTTLDHSRNIYTRKYTKGWEIWFPCFKEYTDNNP